MRIIVIVITVIILLLLRMSCILRRSGCLQTYDETFKHMYS